MPRASRPVCLLGVLALASFAPLAVPAPASETNADGGFLPNDGADLTIGRASGKGARKADPAVQQDRSPRATKAQDDATKPPDPNEAKKLAAFLATSAVSSKDGPSRERSVRALGLMTAAEDPERRGLGALTRIALIEPDENLRGLARNGLAARQDRRVPKAIALALGNKNPAVRENALAAAKGIGGPGVIEVVIEHWRETWGPGPRGHVLFAQQRAYVSDYDISGAVFDPVIQSFLTGTVLDAKSLFIERDYYVVTMRALAGDEVNLPNDPAAWGKWLDKERPQLAKAAREKAAAAVEVLKKPKENAVEASPAKR